MSLADELADLTIKRPRPTKFDLWLDSLDDDDRKALEAIAVNPAVSSNQLTPIVHKHGGPKNWQTVVNWRRSLGFPL